MRPELYEKQKQIKNIFRLGSSKIKKIYLIYFF